MQSFFERKNPKINIKKKVREVTQSRFVKAITSRFETPLGKVILKTTITFVVLGILTVLFPKEEGPTLQVAISLAVSIYFIHERLKSRIRAFLYGVGSFLTSWLLGTFLMVSVMPSLFQGPRSLEEMTLDEYEKVKEEKRKALLALKAEERKVEIDKELQSMQQLSLKKGNDEVFIMLGSEGEVDDKIPLA
ncbi:protein CHAPERONE-LIKE PROTEIN OF POR1, chloroplastic-like isoform X2 [Ananas comosus]|uniref:Protein CHAPERONE-LIKE PROTEIN OF POR1, chloroplastic-like isoform X2 n=1 Tax=Ananas comosus TaxID=4615 RepID=A0A6P5HF46_ANACO|nr:protein CHAPERONE-LIKE PROTEIN OF POR1, chloroplastic-like isoform X2 [Ananas comosus]